MKPPAIANAEQTIPPTISAVTIPAVPFKPTAAKMKEERISVIIVIPDTGLLPTVAMAVAATVVNRKAKMKTISRPTITCVTFIWSPPKAKKMPITTNKPRKPKRMIFIEMSRCVRSTCCCGLSAAALLPLKIVPIEVLMTPADLMTPRMPAMAMPPIPIRRA